MSERSTSGSTSLGPGPSRRRLGTADCCWFVMEVSFYCLLLIAYCLLLIAYCLLLIAYCLLLIAYCLFLIAFCLFLIFFCLLLIAYCLLLIRVLRFAPPSAVGRPSSSRATEKQGQPGAATPSKVIL